MSVAANLRYYRSQFDPEGAYSQGQNSPEIVSMYNPQVMNQLMGTVEKMQQRYDVGKTAEAQEIARIGELETYDLSELNNRLKSFESNINSLVKDKYNGDYGAAANEIARAIGTERTNPFYHFNKQKVEMGKAYLDAKMKLGANFLTNKNPMEVKFQDWQNGETFDFTPINRNDIVENSAAVFSTLAKTIMEDPQVSSTADGMLLKIAMQRGLEDPEAVQEYLRTDPGKAMMQQVYNSMPELEGIEDQDRVQDALIQGAYKAIGETDINFVGNPSYLDANEKAKLEKSTGVSGKTTRVGYVEGPKGTAVPLYQINPLWGTTSPENTEIEANQKQIDTYVTKMQPGDIVGQTEKDSRLLKDIDKKQVVGFSFVPTEDPNNPLEIRLKLSATPKKTKGTGTPTPIEINAKILPQAVDDNLNLFTYLSRLDYTILKGYLDQLKTINPKGYENTIKLFGLQ
jgi:hypothetical protein